MGRTVASKDDRAVLLALLQDARDHLDDDTPRLVLADWLEEHGEPERAEHVRLQVTSYPNEPTPLDEEFQLRARALEKRHRDAWLGPLRDVDEHCWFRRGLVRLDTTPNGLLGEAMAAAARSEAFAWVGHVDLDLGDAPAEELTRMFASGHLARVPSLRLRADGPLTPAKVKALAAGPDLAGVSALHMDGDTLSAKTLATLLASPHLGRLVDLDLMGNTIGDAGARARAASPHLAAVVDLSLSKTRVGNEGAKALAASPHLTSLKWLDLSNTRDSSEGALAIMRSPLADRLYCLVLEGTRLSDKAIDALVERFGESVLL